VGPIAPSAQKQKQIRGVESIGFPLFPQKKAERMGHGSLFLDGKYESKKSKGDACEGRHP
jgi:hypothetical protein